MCVAVNGGSAGAGGMAGGGMAGSGVAGSGAGTAGSAGGSAESGGASSGNGGAAGMAGAGGFGPPIVIIEKRGCGCRIGAKSAPPELAWLAALGGLAACVRGRRTHRRR
jgi:hypothetical protein